MVRLSCRGCTGMSTIARKLMASTVTEPFEYWISFIQGLDIINSIAVDSQGNIIAVGVTDSYQFIGPNDIFVIKFDTNGKILWFYFYGGIESDFGFGVTVDSQDNIIVVGDSQSFGAPSTTGALIFKLDTEGTIQWARFLGGSVYDTLRSVAVDSSDNVIATGETRSTGTGYGDALVVKYNSSGTLQWQRVLAISGSNTTQSGYSIAVDSSNNILIAGTTGGFAPPDGILCKLSSTGGSIWNRQFAHSTFNYSCSLDGVAVDSSDNIFAVGRSSLYGALVAKVSSSASLLLKKGLGGSLKEAGRAVSIDSFDNVILVGYSEPSSDDILIVKYNNSGALQWQKNLGTSNDDYGRAVALDSQDNIVGSGYTSNSDLMTFKLPSDGTGDGTYGPFIYQDESLIENTASPDLVYGSITLTNSTSPLTNSVVSLVQVFVIGIPTTTLYKVTP